MGPAPRSPGRCTAAGVSAATVLDRLLGLVLIVALSLEALLTGFVTLAFILGTAQQPNSDVFGYLLGFAFLAMFVLSGLALLGVSLRTAWSRWAAIAAGILISWTCVGLVIGIPVVVTAARAPDLTPRKR